MNKQRLKDEKNSPMKNIDVRVDEKHVQKK